MSFLILLSLIAKLMPVSTECAAALLYFRYPSNNSNNNCIYLWNCTVVLLHLELSSLDYDCLCCVISPCPLHPIPISFVCYLLNLHHSSWIS